MRLILINDVVPGSRLGKTLYREDGRVLLHRGTELSSGYLDTLRRTGYPALYVLDPHSDGLHVAEPITERTRQEAIGAVRDTFRKIREPSGSMNQDWTSRRILYNTATNIISDLQANKNLNLQVAELRTVSTYAFNHSVNVTVLGLALGEKLGYPYGKLADLAMGLLLHDIGKTALPAEHAHYHEGAEPNTDETYRQHCRLGFDSLQRLGSSISGPARIIALQHHERYDGSGFPKGLKGDTIHEFAQVAAICNTFDNMIHDLVGGRPTPAHQAMEYLMASGGSHFNYRIVTEFLKLLVPFPIESAVRLSNKSEGIVVSVDKTIPMRPTVLVTVDPDGRNRMQPYEIDLRQYPDITIIHTL